MTGDPSSGSTTLEDIYWRQGYRRVAGVDEVGRGSAVSAVVACAVVLPPRLDGTVLGGVRDSKLLSRGQRRRVAPLILRTVIAVGFGAASLAEIERWNVRRATALAMRRALSRVDRVDVALIDGRPMPELDDLPCRFVVDGDALSLSVACASILAKELRDDLLIRLGRRYPAYGWDHNAGYLTTAHEAALRMAGVTPHHRRSFLGRILH
ncbi:MAG: ribonuclease HII [Chloroflexi bacterium]|nr:ribonuclease HII [Chloroflexota bacterium]